MSHTSMDGKTAIVTGGSKGYGAGIAEALRKAGANVWITGRDEEALKVTAERLGVHPVVADVASGADWDRLFETVVATDGRVDILVNNAGAAISIKPLQEIADADIERCLAVNLTGSLLGCKRASRIMKEQRSGSIINTGSIAGVTAGRGPIVYSAAKAAVVHLSKVTSMELGEHNIRVNCICPGYIATPLSAGTVGRPDSLIEDRLDTYTERQPIQRPGLPEDIAQMALYLAGDRSTFVTGQAMVVDGGAITGVLWKDQKEVYKKYYPIKVYNPDAG